MSHGPLLLIVSSPSGAGKTTLTNALRERVDRLEFSVSHTTRSPRASEQDGREYHFVSKADFQKEVASDAFLEWAEVHGNLYGTSQAEIERAGDARGLIFDVDHQGARQLKSQRPDAVAIFILPPSLKPLYQRLKGRASEDAATVNRRFEVAQEEIAHYGLFDYVLMNDDLETAIDQLGSIFKAEECRRLRSANLAEQLLREGRVLDGDVPPTS